MRGNQIACVRKLLRGALLVAVMKFHGGKDLFPPDKVVNEGPN